MPLFVFLICILFCSKISPFFEGQQRTIVWNVGQGQWITVVMNDSCQHFDMGGEFYHPSKIKYYCSHKRNYVYFTHSDFDHIAFYKRFKSLIPQRSLCLPPPHLKKNHYLKKEPKKICLSKPVYHLSFNNFKSTNDTGNIFLVDNLFIPGDISKKVEKKWLNKSSGLLKKIHVIVLAHHGSSTSNSDELISSLIYLNLAISSSRFQRYGHPHHKTHQLLQKLKVPLLTTESWGNIIIEN